MPAKSPPFLEVSLPEERSLKSPTLTEISSSSGMDYEGEYKALQVLFEAISTEAETLREELVQQSVKTNAHV